MSLVYFLMSSMHLKPLRRHFEEMEECDYLELEQRIPALFHVICLVWANTRHYQQPARIVVLLQEVTNLLIEQVRLAYIVDKLTSVLPCRPATISLRRY